MNRVNAFLQSEAATLLLLAMALIAQTPHAATVFWRLSESHGANWFIWSLLLLHCIAYAIALEFATLIFVVRGQSQLAWTFAGVSVAVNFAYYFDGSMTIGNMIRAALISVALPASIAFYSHSVAEAQEHAPATMQSDAEPIAMPSQEAAFTVALIAEPTQITMQAETQPLHMQAYAMQEAGKTIAEIAEALQKSQRTVCNYIAKAKEGMQPTMQLSESGD